MMAERLALKAAAFRKPSPHLPSVTSKLVDKDHDQHAHTGNDNDAPASRAYRVDWARASIWHSEADDEINDTESFEPSVSVLPSLRATSSISHTVSYRPSTRARLSKRTRKAQFAASVSEHELQTFNTYASTNTKPPLQPLRAVTAARADRTVKKSQPSLVPFSHYQRLMQSEEKIQQYADDDEEDRSNGGQRTQLRPLTPLSPASLSATLTSPLRSLSLSPSSSQSVAWRQIQDWYSNRQSYTAQSRAYLLSSLVDQSQVTLPHHHHTHTDIDGDGGSVPFPSTMTPIAKESFLSFVHGYVRELSHYESPTLFAQSSYHTMMAINDRSDCKGLQPLLAFLSFDLIQILLSSTHTDTRAVADTSIVSGLLSVVCDHLYLRAQAEHFPLVPYHLHCNSLSLNIDALSQRRAQQHQSMLEMSLLHRQECERWQRVVSIVTAKYSTAVLKLVFHHWRQSVSKSRHRRTVWSVKLQRLRDSQSSKHATKSIFIALRQITAADKLATLQQEHAQYQSEILAKKLSLRTSFDQQDALESAYQENAASLQQLTANISNYEYLIQDRSNKLTELSHEIEHSQGLIADFVSLTSLLFEELQLQYGQLQLNDCSDLSSLSLSQSSATVLPSVESESVLMAPVSGATLRWRNRSINAVDANDSAICHSLGWSAATSTSSVSIVDVWTNYQQSHFIPSQPPLTCSVTDSVAINHQQQRSLSFNRDSFLLSLKTRSQSPHTGTLCKEVFLRKHFQRDSSYKGSLSHTETSTSAMTNANVATTMIDSDSNDLSNADSLLVLVQHNQPFLSTLGFTRVEDYLTALVAAEEFVDGSEPLLSMMTEMDGNKLTRSRVPHSPLVQALAQTISANNSSSGGSGVQRAKTASSQYSATQPLTIVSDTPAVTPTVTDPSITNTGTSNNSSNHGIEHRPFTTSSVDSHSELAERRKKNLTIEINPQRTSTAPSATAGQSQAIGYETPALPPMALAGVEGSAATSTSANTSTGMNSARQRFHRSQARPRTQRSTSVFSTSSLTLGGDTPTVSSTSAWPRSPRTDYDSLTISGSGASRPTSANLVHPMQPMGVNQIFSASISSDSAMTVSPLTPALSASLASPNTNTSTGTGRLQALPMTISTQHLPTQSHAFDVHFQHNQIIHDSGLSLRPIHSYHTVSAYPYVHRAIDAMVVRKDESVVDEDIHRAGLHWLYLTFPALANTQTDASSEWKKQVSCDWQTIQQLIDNDTASKLKAHSTVETNSDRGNEKQPISSTDEMQQVFDAFRRSRRLIALKRDEGAIKQRFLHSQYKASEKTLTSALLSRIRLMDNDKGRLAAQQSAQELEAIYNQSQGSGSHSRLASASTIGSTSDEPLSSVSMSQPHHRTRSSLKSTSSLMDFGIMIPSLTVNRPTRVESYTRIRSSLQTLCAAHQRPVSSASRQRTRNNGGSMFIGNNAGSVATTTSPTSMPMPSLTRSKSSVEFNTHRKPQPSIDLSAMPYIPEGGSDDDSDDSEETNDEVNELTSAANTKPSTATHISTGSGNSNEELSVVHRCERVLGHFYSDFRRVFKHAIETDNSHTTNANTSTDRVNTQQSLVMNGLQWLRFTRHYKLGSTQYSYHQIDELYAKKLSTKQGVYESLMNRVGSIDTLHFDDFMELLTIIAMESLRDISTVSTRLYQFFTTVLFPRTSSMDSLRVEMTVTNTHTVFDKHHSWLLSLFSTYASQSYNCQSLLSLHLKYSLNLYSANTMDEQCLTVADFLSLVSDSTLVGDNVLTLEQAAIIFKHSQMDNNGEDYFAGDALLNYAEFQESLCGLACYYSKSPYESLECKLDSLIVRLQSSPHIEEKRHKHAIYNVNVSSSSIIGSNTGLAHALSTSTSMPQLALPALPLA